MSSLSFGMTVIPGRNWIQWLGKILEVNNVYYSLSKEDKYENKSWFLHLNHQIKLIKYLTSLCLNRDLSYLYLPSACDLKERFFLKSLSINVLFGNIDRKIGQVFPWGINTLTFPPKEWGAEPTPHSPPSREGSGGGGFGREPTPHCGVIYSYIHKIFTRKSAAVVCCCTQKSAALPKMSYI